MSLSIDFLRELFDSHECVFDVFEPLRSDILLQSFLDVDNLCTCIYLLNLLIYASYWSQIFGVFLSQVEVLADIIF
jgi:hypothetical protein